MYVSVIDDDEMQKAGTSSSFYLFTCFHHMKLVWVVIILFSLLEEKVNSFRKPKLITPMKDLDPLLRLQQDTIAIKNSEHGRSLEVQGLI